MTGRPRGRPRGRPKGSGRGRGRGRASQTEGPFQRRESRSPPLAPSCKPAGGGGLHMISSAHGLPLSPHPGAPPPGAYPYTPPSQTLQPPGLPHPPPQIQACGAMPRVSSHGKTRHPDEQSLATVSSGTQATWHGLQFSGSGRHSQDSPSSRPSSGSRQAVEAAYSRQSLDHPPFGDFRGHGTDHQERPSARKSHRQARDFPFLQEFEPAYNGQKEKRFSSSSSSSSSSGQRHDKEPAGYGSQRLGGSSEKALPSKYQVKDVSQRIQFENMEPTYQKQKSYCDPRHDRDLQYANRRSERDPSYDSQRQERDQRCSGLRRDRDSFQTSSRRERDVSYGVQRVDLTRRSSSADSNHSYESQCTDRDTSPHFSPSPSTGYHPQETQPYGRESRSHSVEREAEFSKHRESSGDRYAPPPPPPPLPPPTAVSFPAPANFSRQAAGGFPEPASRHAERDAMFSASSMYGMEPHLQTKDGCSGKAGKSSKSNGWSSGRGSSSVPGQCGQRVASYPDLLGHEARVDGRPVTDSSWKKTAELQESHARNGSSERSVCGPSDRERSSSSSRKKQTSSSSRDPSAEVYLPPLLHYSQQGSYLPPSPYSSSGCAAASIPRGASAAPASSSAQRGQYKTNFSPCEEEYSSLRVPRQQASFTPLPQERDRPSRPARPSPPSSPSSQSPYPSRPPTPPLYSPRPASPAPFPPHPPRSGSPGRQQFHKAEERPGARRSSRLAEGGSNPVGCQGAVEKKNAQTSPGLPAPQRAQRRSSRGDESPESEEPPPPAEPMAWQQQYLKHLQQQQQQEEQILGEMLHQEEQMHQEPAKQQVHMGREQLQREQVKKTHEQVQREIQQEQMRKQQEQMHREYIKIQQEKMQREHLQLLEQLQREHMIQLEQMRNEHMKQQQEQMQREHMKQQDHGHRDNFKQRQERLLREQMKQQDKLRREHLKQQEHMQREHTKLQQEYLQCERLKFQEQMRCEQQERTQREFMHQELMQKHKLQQQQQQQHRAPEDDEHVQMYPRQLPDCIQQRYEQIQKQQQQELRLQQHEQFNPAQDHQQPQYHSDHPEYQQRFQQQQQPNASQEQRPHQQQYPQHPPQNPSESGQQQYQQQQQQLRQQQPQIMQCPLRQQRQLSLQPQQHNSREHAPVPPWRQGANGGESRGYIPHPVDSSPARHEAQTASPARHPPHQNISPARQPHQGFPPASVPHQSISLSTQPHQSVVSFASATQPHQLRPSPVGQMPLPHNGSHALVTANSGSYAVPGSEQSMVPPVSQPNGAVQLLPGLQAQYQSQHHSGQIMVQSQQTFEAHGPPPTGSSSDQQGPKPKKPPWLQDQEAQVMCTQKKPPWQQQPEHVIIVAGQEAVVGGSASQFPAEAGSAVPGQQFPVQPQTVGMSGPPTLRRMAVNSLQDQGQLRHPSHVDPLAGGGGVPHQQTLVSAHSQQNPHHHSSYDSSGHAYSNGLQTRPRVTQAQIHGTVLSGAVESSGGHHYSQHSVDPQRLPSSALTVSGHNNPANVHVVFSRAGAATNPPRSHVYLHHASGNSSNEGMYPYQTPSGFSAASVNGSSSTTDQEGAQQVLVEALNEQVQQSGLHASNTGHGVVMNQGVQIVDPNNAGVQMHSMDACLVSSVDAQRQPARNPPGLETYTLHHLFDDSNRMQPHAQVLPPHSREGQFHPHQQRPHQQLAMEQDHQVVPGNPLDTAVAMLKFPDSALDIPMIEQHQVFVLEPPGTGAHNKQPSAALASSSDVPAARRNSWHTPEHSVAGSRPGSFADDDAELVIDLSTELCEEDDDIFSTQEPAPTSTAAASKAPPQESVSFTNTGINDLGLRISSVFSLATTRRRKRRTMSDSVLQEVELVERQQGLFDGGLGDSLVITKGNNRQRHPSTTSSQTQNSAAASADSGLDFAFPQDQKGVCALDGVYGFNSSAQDPLAELTKLLFAGDMSVPSPGTSTAEDWNLQEAAGVSFEADSVCVPGTPARGEPERLTTPLPQLFTPMPQMGTPMPLCYKDPGTPFQRHVPVSQYIKNPTTPLPACAKETKEQQSTPLPATPFAAYHSTDVKEPMASLPQPAREVKKASLPTSSCAMGPPPLLPGFAVKAKDPSVPLPQCAKGSTASLTPCRQEPSVASQNSTSGTTRQQSAETVLEIGVEPLEKIISKKVERASKQPLEQAIRELLGDEPIEKVTEKSFRERTGKSPRRDRVKVPAQQPQRKSERISAKETMTTCSDVQVEKTSEPPVSEKDVRSRVKDNWERRCISKIASTPKSITSRSRDSSRESDPGKRRVQIIPEPTAGGGCHRNKTPPRTRMPTKAEKEEEEEKKSCGVRGRRTMTMAGKRRHVSGTHSSVEDASPDRRGLPQVTEGSHKPWLQSMRSLSQDSSDGEGDTKPPCNKDSIKREAEAHPAEDTDQDAFFPSLSRTNSTDSSSSIEDSGNAGEREKRRRLSSCESRVSRRSSQCSCEEEVGENIADMILPTVFPPSRRRRRNDVATTAGSTDLLATFHEHKLRCLEMEGEHYVVLEEVLAKCFPGLPRAQVERARLRDLNLLTRTVHVLGSGLPGGDGGEAVSVMALPDAARLLHFFHGMLPCPGTDCRLRRSSPEDRQGSQPSDSSCLQKHNADEVLKTGVPRSGSLGFKCTDRSNAVDGKTVRAVGGRARAESSGDDGVEEAVAESDAHEDTRSCHSDQTLPYCDGQPLMAWEEESVTKSGNNSDGERAASPSIPSNAVGGRKFRRHSSDSEGRVRQLRDKEGLHRSHLPKSPDNVSLGGTSPMLPPLLTYVTSPFTPGSMYNVPMDNERVLLECFSAPGSQAPSSVRSAPSVRLLSPDRADPAHFDEDFFEGLSSHKFLSEFESVNANAEPPSKQLATSLLNGKALEEDKPEDCLAAHSVGCGVRSRTESVDFHDLHCTVDFDVEESDDVFLEEGAQSEEGRHHSKPSDYRLKDVRAGLEKGCFLNDSSGADKGNKDTLGKLFEKTLQCQRNEVYTTLPLTADLTFPSSVAEKQQFSKKDSNSVNSKLMPSRDRETERQLARHLDEKLSALVAGENEAERCDRDQFQNNDSLKCASSGKTTQDVAEKDPLDDRYDRVSVEGSARSSVSANLSELDPVSLNPSSETTRLSTEAPSLAIERKSSDATIAYGASDEEADVNSNTEKPNQAWLGSQDSTGPPQLSTVRGSVQTNTSPHTSPPRIDPVTIDKTSDQPYEQARERSRRLLREEEESQDERRPPEASDGSLEDRVQDFIAHGKQFTPRAVMRSNSLPDLCGAESLPSPVRAGEEESKYYTPGSVTHRSASYPGASNNSSSSGSAGNISDPVSSTEGSSVPSPPAPQSTAISDPAAPEKRRETSAADPSGATASCALSPRSVKETTNAPDTKASSDQIPEPDEAVFLDPADVVDGGEVCTRATPRRSPQASADVGPDQLFEWAVPCAAHGSVFCSCEGIDIQEVAASPRVGPWLCTPGTPAPATPFCDYSRLIYSPFPVEAGMTPARPDGLTGSPKLPLTPELDAMVCGVKRVAPTEGHFTPAEGQAAAKRRPISPSLQNDESVKSSCCDSDVIERNGDVEGHRDVGGGGGGGRDGAAGDEETDKQLLDSEELELIAAAEESERNMANLSSEEKLQLTSFPAEEGLLPLTTASDISDGSLMVDTDTARADSDSVHTALHPSEKVEGNAPLHQGIKPEESAPLIQCDTLEGNASLNQCDKIENNTPLNQCDTLEGDAPLNQLGEIEDSAPLNQRDKRAENASLNQRDKLAASAVLQLSDTRVPHHDPSQHSTTADFGDVEENPFKPASCDTDDDKTPLPKEPRTNPSADPITTDNNVANSDKTAINSGHTDTLDPLTKTPVERSELCVQHVISRTTENFQTQNSQTENMEETEEMPEVKTSPLTKLLPNRTMPCDLSDTRVVPDTAIPYAVSDIKPVPDSTIAYDILDTKTVSGAVSSCDMPVTKVVPDSTIPDDISNSKRVPDITISHDVLTTTLAPDSTMSPNDDISDTKVGPDRGTGAYDISDTNSVGTTDSESVPDVRIIALGDFDLTSLESEDSSDSTEVTLSPKVPEPDLKQPGPENKKTLTLAQYRERNKKRANSRDSTSWSGDCKAAETETGATETPKASDSEVDGTPQEKEKTQIVDKPVRDVPSPKPSAFTSRECVTSAKSVVTSGEHVPKVQRTESVPAEPSRRVAVQLKRSSSFHGHSPASKRFKYEGEENMDTTKADRSRLPKPDDQEGRSPPKLIGEDIRGSSHRGNLCRARRASAEACPGSTTPNAELKKKDGKRTEETKGKVFETKKDDAKKQKVKRDGDRNAGMSMKEREEKRGEEEEEKKKSEDSRISQVLFCVCEMTNTSDVTKRTERNDRREMSEINSDRTEQTEMNSRTEGTEIKDRTQASEIISDRTEQTDINDRTEGTEIKDRTQASEIISDRTEQTDINDRTEGTEIKDRTQASEIISDRTEQTDINDRTEQSMEVDQVSQSMNDVNTEPRGCSDANELSGSVCQSMADVTEHDTELAALTQHMTEQKGVTYGFAYSTCDTPVQDERWPTPSMDEKRMSIPDQDDLILGPSEGRWMITLTPDERMSTPQQDTLISTSAKDAGTSPSTRDETVSTPKQRELIPTSSQGVCMPTSAHGERIATSDQEDLMPTSTEDEGMPTANDDVRMSSPTQDESMLTLNQDACMENPTQDGNIPVPDQDERIPTPAEYARMSTPIQDESMSTPTPDETLVIPTPDENVPIPTHDRNVPPPVKNETVSAPISDRNTSASTQDDSMSTIRQNDRMPTLTQPQPVSSPSRHEQMSSPAQPHERMSSPTQHQPHERMSSPTQHERLSSPTQHQPMSFRTQHERMPFPVQHHQMSSPIQHERMSSPIQHERMSSPIQHERMSSPTQHEPVSFQTQHHGMSSPTQHERLSSPTQHERMSSPNQHHPVSSLSQQQRMSSPAQHQPISFPTQPERMSPPTQHQRMSSPIQHQRMSSPAQHQPMSSPTQHDRMSSPIQHERMPSPIQHERLSSPIQQQPMSSPTPHEGQSSPTQHERTSSPTRHQPVPSPTQHKRISSLPQQEMMPSSIQHERMSSPTQGKRLPFTTEDEPMSVPSEKERAPSTTQHERMSGFNPLEQTSVTTEVDRISSPTEDGRMPSPDLDERMSFGTEDESVSRTSTPTLDERMQLDHDLDRDHDHDRDLERDVQPLQTGVQSKAAVEEPSDIRTSDSAESPAPLDSIESTERSHHVCQQADQQHATAAVEVVQDRATPVSDRDPQHSGPTTSLPSGAEAEAGDHDVTGTGGARLGKELSEQLAALLREKESMLEEFRRRAMELERTVQDLRVELQETKKKANEPELA